MTREVPVQEGAFDRELKNQVNANFSELYGSSGTVEPNAPNVKTITPGTGFTVAGTASDTIVYNYRIIS